MCKSCLSIKLRQIDETIETMKEELQYVSCDCCVAYAKFCTTQMFRIKLLCHIKLKMEDDNSPKLETLADTTHTDIRNALDNFSSELFDKKETIQENEYLEKMDELKDIYNHVQQVIELSHK